MTQRRILYARKILHVILSVSEESQVYAADGERYANLRSFGADSGWRIMYNSGTVGADIIRPRGRTKL